MKKILLKADSKGKGRVIKIWTEESDGVYYIKSINGMYLGKMKDAPTTTIKEGKAKRTLEQQVKLQFDSIVKKKVDGGYEVIDVKDEKDPEIHNILLTIKEQIDKVGFRLGSAGQPLAQKAYAAKDKPKEVDSLSTKIYFASYKLDGVRCFLQQKDGVIQATSIKGTSYNNSCAHIINDPAVIAMFKKHPNVVLDGELYVHGYTLQELSGWARSEKTETLEKKTKGQALQFHAHDCLEFFNDGPQRADVRDWTLRHLFNNFKFKDVIYVDQIRCEYKDYAFYKELHDKAVALGYEGLMIKDIEGQYEAGSRTTSILKIKEYEDGEFKIIGYTPGNKRKLDFVFQMITDEGVEFEATPMGTEALRQYYLDNMDTIIGKMATVKYFNFTEERRPFQPSFKCIRDYE